MSRKPIQKAGPKDVSRAKARAAVGVKPAATVKPAKAKKVVKTAPVRQFGVILETGKLLMTVRGNSSIVSLFDSKDAAERAAHRAKGQGAKPRRVTVSPDV